VVLGCSSQRPALVAVVWWGGAAAWGGRGTDQRCRCAPGATGANHERSVRSS